MPNRWRQVESLCHAALARPADARAAFLADACADDATLRAEVESLLAGAESTPSILESAVEGPSRPPLVGRQLGAYRIDAPIGAGGMGEVYRARDTRLGRDVAVKILPAAFALDPQRRTRFEREARAVAALKHPHICTIHDVGHDEGIEFLVMELVDGESLAARLAKGPLPLNEALAHAIEIAHALVTAHAQGIIHRDLKPGNVMLAKTGIGTGGATQAKLLDFGLARIIPSGVAAGATVAIDASPATETGVLLGTLQYMAPEQVEGRPADARTDIFAFGAVFYEMLTGRRAFAGATTAALMAVILREEPPPVHPPDVGRIVRRCLSKDPVRRYQSARDLLNDLDEARQHPAIGEFETRDAAARVPARIAWWVAAAALLVAVAAGWMAATRRPAEGGVVRSTLLAPEGTEFDFSEGAPALSPDGRRIAFLARRADGTRQIWVRALESLSAQPLAGTERATHPFWAPDGNALGFFSDLKLRRMDLGNGEIRALCDVERTARGAAWGPDGTILFARSGLSVIYRVPASGGPSLAATEFDAGRKETTHRFPVFLPNGRDFLFFSTGDPSPGDPPDHLTLFMASLDSKTRKPITWADSSVAYSTSGHLLFLRGDTLFTQRFDASRLPLVDVPVEISSRVSISVRNEAALSVGKNGTLVYQTGIGELSQLGWLDRNGRLLATVGAPAPTTTVELSHDGRKVALVVQDPRTERDIWVRDLERDTATKISLEPGHEYCPVWSPDDRRLFFAVQDGTHSSTATRASIVSRTADGTGALLTVHAAEKQHYVLPTSVSSDGSFLATMTGKESADFDIGVLPLAGRAPQLLSRPEHMEMNGQLAGRQSRWLAYQSDESGRTEVYVQRLDREELRFPISTGGGTHPRWRRDGRELFYLSPDLRLMAVDITLEPSFSAGIPKMLFEPKVRPFLGYQYDVSPDGQRFLVLRTVKDQNEPPLILIQNWAKDIAGGQRRY